MKQISKGRLLITSLLLLSAGLILTGGYTHAEAPEMTLFMPNGRTYTMDQDAADLPLPAREETSIGGCTWYIYNSDYSNFMMMAVDDGKVLGFYTNSQGFKLSNGVNYGDQFTLDPEHLIFGHSYIHDHAGDLHSTLRYYYDPHTGYSLHAVLCIEIWLDFEFLKLDSPEQRRVQALENFDAVNAFRANPGKDPLMWDEDVARAAEAHSQDTADHGYIGHDLPDGKGPTERFLDIRWREQVSCGENIYCGGVGEGMEAFAAWVTSRQGHREIMLGNLKYLGVGLAETDGLYFMTQLFVTY